MKKLELLTKFLGVGLLVIGLPCNTVWAQGGGQNNGSKPSHVPGRILVKFKDGVEDGRARGVLAGRGGLSTDVIPEIGVHIVQLPPNADEQAEANVFKGLDEVEFAQIDGII